MTLEEAIEYLSGRYLVANFPSSLPKEECEKHNEVMDMAMNALDKQIPKKVNKFFKAPDGYLSNGDCPSCKERVDEGTMYCEACGQAIDWSVEK